MLTDLLRSTLSLRWMALVAAPACYDPNLSTTQLTDTGGRTITGEGISASIVTGSEEPTDGSGASDTATTAAATSASMVTGGEGPTDGSAVSDTTTTAAATSGATTTEEPQGCGNGVVEGDEQCDDGNEVNFDECTNKCLSTVGVDCDPDIPGDFACGSLGLYCDADGTCGGCHQLKPGKTCTDVNPEIPACDPDSGACVQCTPDNVEACTADEACDPFMSYCTQCNDHRQCPSGACNMYLRCIPEDAVVWVEPRPDCGMADGSPEFPFCQLEDALASGPWSEWNELAIKLRPGTEPILAIPTISNNAAVAILGQKNGMDQSPTIGDPLATSARITVDGNSHLFISDVRIVDSQKITGDLILCADGDLWLDRLEISENKGDIRAESTCRLHIRQSVVTKNTGSILTSDDFALIQNSFITENDAGAGAPIRPLSANPWFIIDYSTVACNKGAYSASVGCTGAGAVRVDNSVVLGDGDPVWKCNLSAESRGSLFGQCDNKADLFVTWLAGIYRAKPGSAIDGMAIWQLGSPYVDFEDDLRPVEEYDPEQLWNFEAPDFAGADRP